MNPSAPIQAPQGGDVKAPGNRPPTPSPTLKGRGNHPVRGAFGFAPSGLGDSGWGAPSQGFTLGYPIAGFQLFRTGTPVGCWVQSKGPGNTPPTPSPALKGRLVTARGEAPGNPTPTPSPALKGRHNHPVRGAFGFAPSGLGDHGWGAPTQGFTLGYPIAGFQPFRNGAPVGRAVTARGAAPGNGLPTPSPGLKGRHVAARGKAPGNGPHAPARALKGGDDIESTARRNGRP